jgi:hypothetical protein
MHGGWFLLLPFSILVSRVRRWVLLNPFPACELGTTQQVQRSALNTNLQLGVHHASQATWAAVGFDA